MSEPYMTATADDVRKLERRVSDNDAEALWRVADRLVSRAVELENEAKELHMESRRLKNLAAALADGRELEVTPC